MLKISHVALVCTLAFLPFLIFQASQLKFGTAFVEAWLPGDDEAKTKYREFRDDFGDDQFLIVSWPDCKRHDPRLEAFSRRLEELADDEQQLGITSVSNSSRAFQDLSKTLDYIRDPGLRETEVAKRLSGVALGKDGSAFILIRLKQASVQQHAVLFSEIETIATDVLKGKSRELILAGEPFQIHVIDRSSRDAMQYFVAPSSVMALLIAWICLRELKLTALVFIFAGIGQLIGMATVSYFLDEMIAVLVVLPTLVFMLTLSAAVHLTNYFIDLRGKSRQEQRIAKSDKSTSPLQFLGVRALRMGMTPCILATATTVFGFASLITSELAPVWQFGLLSALSLVLASGVMLVNFPATASKIQSLGRNDRASSKSESPIATGDEKPRLTIWLGHLTGHFASWISIMGIAGLVFALVGLTRLESSTEFEDMFRSDSPALRSLRWVREHVGPIHALEVLVQFRGDDGPLEITDELSSLQQLSRGLQRVGQVASTTSAVTFLPEMPTGGGARTTVLRAVMRRKLTDRLPELESRGLLHTEESDRVWRITTRIEKLRGDNYDAVRRQLLSNLELTANELKADRPGIDVNVELAGIRTVVERAHHALIRDLATSFAAAFVLITPVMMLIVRGFWSGLVLMIPNVLPVALVFGSMGWLGVRLDVASILTASVALGIAVDDTLHFVSWFFRSRRMGNDAETAVQHAIERCARPMLHTTLICTFAMAPFFLSDFLPTSKFALLMILILWGAILGDLIVLPALLQSPLGRWIGSRQAALANQSGGSTDNQSAQAAGAQPKMHVERS